MVLHTDYPDRVHLFGAPGSGVSTLGRAIALQTGAVYFDVDDFYWFTDDELPYRRRRNPDHRRKLLREALAQHQKWVLGGSLCGWGDEFIPQFELVIWCWETVEVRLERIRERETRRYGAERIAPGGDLHAVFEKFCTWAAAYDEPSDNPRCRDRELAWLEALPCPVQRQV
ncbi:MAG: hypothetical protein IT269_00670 [Saprospiraceae bacterium]|nr:hypothetical protein [Saprospiraceae bacterium]